MLADPQAPVPNMVILARHLQLGGARILDVGCGDGMVARALRRKGAVVWGIDPEATAVEAFNADTNPVMGMATVGGADSLPWPDGAFDIALFFNSLHHIPPDLMEKSLAEAWRTIRSGGHLVVVEPVADGAYFEVVRMIDDETEVRALAQQAVAEWGAAKKVVPDEVVWDAPVLFPDVDALSRKLVAVDPRRAEIVEREQAELVQRFHALAERTDKGQMFRQPMTMHLFRKMN
jgi:SAM-dependent methyltransferase